MQRIQSSNTVTSLPTKTDDGTAGFFTPGNTATGEKATYLSADWCNTVQEELAALATASGLSLDTDDNTQCATAVAALISAAIAALKTTLQAEIDEKADTESPTLTGTPAAPTAASGTSTTQIATTAFVMTAIAALKAAFPDGAYSLAQSGYANLPSWLLGGLQIRWGRFTAAANATTAVTFAQSFSNACFVVVSDGIYGSGDNSQDNGPAVVVSTIKVSGFSVFSADSTADAACYFAVGY